VVAVFARLKWRLTTSRIRTAATGTRVATGFGICLGAAFVVLIDIGLVMLRGHQNVAIPVVTGIFTFQLLAWVLAPLMAFGVDETVDPHKFALLPLRPAVLQRGLLVSSLVGYLPIANAILLAGCAIALSNPWGLLPIALVCAGAQLVMCVVFCRAAATSMVSLMSSRRGRDLGMLVGFGVILLYFLFSFAVNSQSGANVVGNSAQSVAGVLSWAPTGALAGLPGWLAGGHFLRVLAAVATVVVFFGFGWWWWASALRRTLTTLPSATAGSSPVGASDLGTAVANSERGMAMLVVGRDARLAWRDPMRRLPWLIIVLLSVGWPFLVVRGNGGVFAVVLGALLIGAQAANQLGIEGSGLWLHVAAFSDSARARGEMFGHALVAVVPGVVVIAIGILVQAAVRSEWGLIPAALGVCLAAMLGAVGAGCMVSATLPYAMPQSRTSMFASSVPGQKGRSTGAAFSVMGIGLATAIVPAVFGALALTGNRAWGWIGLISGLVVGAGVFLVLSRVGASRYVARAPEILSVVALGDRS
jgi:ABC-2 type transport system permease protein